MRTYTPVRVLAIDIKAYRPQYCLLALNNSLSHSPVRLVKLRWCSASAALLPMYSCSSIASCCRLKAVDDIAQATRRFSHFAS
jgi:hypothetical protein